MKFAYRALICFALFQNGCGEIFAANVSLNGYVNRAMTRILLTVVVQGTESELGANEVRDLTSMQVLMYDVDQDEAILAGDDKLDAAPDAESSSFYWEHASTPSRELVGTDKIAISYSLVVKSNPSYGSGETIASLLEKNSLINIEIKYQKVDLNVSKKSLAVKHLTAVPNAGINGFTTSSVHKGVKASWEGNAEVSYTANSEGTELSFKPDSVLLMVIPRESAANIPLEASIVDPQTGTHEATVCTIVETDSDSDSCVRCPEGDVYINAQQNDPDLLFSSRTNNVAQGVMTLQALDIGTEYIAFMQYVEGTKRTSCKSFVPLETISLTEANGEAEGIESDPRCFIATAAFGSSMSSEVQSLRWFRDRFLLPTDWGKSLVEAYYSYSPFYASLLNESPILKVLVQFVLWPIVWLTKLVKALMESKVLTMIAFSAIIGMLLVSLGKMRGGDRRSKLL